MSSSLPYFFSIAVLGAFTALGGPALPGLAENTGSTLDQISLYFALGSLGYLLGSFFGGRLYDRLPGNRLLSLTLLVIALSGALIPTAGRLWWLLAVQFILGLAQGVNDVGCNTLLLWVHRGEAGPYLNGLHFSFGLGTSLSPLVLAGFLSQGGGFQWAFWIFALVSLPLAAWFWKLPDAPGLQEQTGQVNRGGRFFPAVYLVLAFLFYVGAELGFGNWVYTYTLSQGLGTAVTAAYLTSIFWGTFTAGRLLGVWISSRFRPFLVLAGDLLGCLASLSLIALWPDSSTALWIGTIGAGLFMASVFPTMLVLASERLEITGSLTSWFLAGGGVGGMILPWVIGLGLTARGPGAMPLLVLGTLVMNLIVVLIFHHRTRPGGGSRPA